MTGNTVATGGGRYRVYVDDAEVSAHTQLHTAIDRMRAEQVDNPEAEVTVAYDFTLRYEPSDEELEGIATDPADEEEPDDTDDGSEGTEDPPEETEPVEDGVIPTDETKLHDYPDPTTLDIYKEYEPIEPKPYELDKPLGDIATSMTPGEWYRLLDAPMTVTTAWNDKALWDAERQRVCFLGQHGRPRPTRWGALDFDKGVMHKQVGNQFHEYAGIHSEWGYRSYGKHAMTPDGANWYARFGRLWRQDPSSLEWEAWAMLPRYDMIGNLESFPEMGALIWLGKGRKFAAYFIEANEWRELPEPVVDGRHSLMRYNPMRGEVMLLGGDDSFRKAQILKPDGTLVNCADALRDTRIRTDQLAVDPISGHYLNLVHESDEARGKTRDEIEFFGYDPDADEWYRISEWMRDRALATDAVPAWPFSSKHCRPAVAVLSGHGVTMWIETNRSGVHLYKHKVP